MLRLEQTGSILLSFLFPLSDWTKRILWSFVTKQQKFKRDFGIDTDFLVMGVVAMTQTGREAWLDHVSLIQNLS